MIRLTFNDAHCFRSKQADAQKTCSYCPQSARYDTGLERRGLLSLEEVREAAKNAKRSGAQRFCMGAAWRSVKDGPDFNRVLEMVRTVKSEGIEACATLGMLTAAQAEQLKEAGLDVYNHNLDSGRNFYQKIIRTRKYDDRLNTLSAVRKAGLTICSGGIIGMGEAIEDRCALIAQLASLDPQPESVPINLLVPVEGTPLQDAKPIDPLELVRTVAVAARFATSSSRPGLVVLISPTQPLDLWLNRLPSAT